MVRNSCSPKELSCVNLMQDKSEDDRITRHRGRIRLGDISLCKMMFPSSIIASQTGSTMRKQVKSCSKERNRRNEAIKAPFAYEANADGKSSVKSSQHCQKSKCIFAVQNNETVEKL
ncbi:hypothetical protein ACFX2I_042954 [Malus domestica]